jgi:hypothetical protein
MEQGGQAKGLQGRELEEPATNLCFHSDGVTVKLDTERNITFNGGIGVRVVDREGRDWGVVKHLLTDVERGFGVVLPESNTALMSFAQNGIVRFLLKLHGVEGKLAGNLYRADAPNETVDFARLPSSAGNAFHDV